MRQNIRTWKATCTFLTLFISVSSLATATESSPEKELRDHGYYRQKLQKLEESTRWIHGEVDRILAEFKRNMNEYYKLTRGSAVLDKPGGGGEGLTESKRRRANSQPPPLSTSHKGKPETGGGNPPELAKSRGRSLSESPVLPKIDYVAVIGGEKDYNNYIQDIMGVLTTKGKACYQNPTQLQQLRADVSTALNVIISKAMKGDLVNKAQFQQNHSNLKDKLKSCQEYSADPKERYKIAQYSMSNFKVEVPKAATIIQTVESVQKMESEQRRLKGEQLKMAEEDGLEKATDTVIFQSGIQIIINQLSPKNKEEIRNRIKEIVRLYFYGGLPSLGSKSLDSLNEALKAKNENELVKKIGKFEDEFTSWAEKQAHGAELDKMFSEKQISEDIPMEFDLSKFAAFVPYPIYDPKSVGAEETLKFKRFNENKSKEKEFTEIMNSKKTGFVLVQSGFLKSGDLFAFDSKVGKVKVGHIDRDEVVYQLDIKTFTLIKGLGGPGAASELSRQDQYYRIDIHDFKKGGERDTAAFLTGLKDKVDNQGYELWSVPLNAKDVIFLAIPQNPDEKVICLNANSAAEIPGGVYYSIKMIREKLMK